jgi:PAS domain S-box-containing protein
MNLEAKKVSTFRSLRTTLVIAFLALSVLILLITSGLNIYSNFQNQQKLIVNQQQLIAQNAANTVKGFIQEKLGILHRATVLGNLATAHMEEQKIFLERLLGKEISFRQIVLLNPQEQELLKVSRMSHLIKGQLTPQNIGKLFPQANREKTFIGPVYFDEISSEPMVIMTAQVTDAIGDFKGILMVEVNLKFMWELVDSIKIGMNGLAYVVDKQGNLIAFSDVSRVLKGENLTHLEEVNEFVKGDELTHKSSANVVKGIQGANVVANHANLGTPDWAVVIELPVTEAYEPIIQQFKISVGIMLLSFVLAIIFGIYLSKRITKPIINLRNAAIKIGEGRLDTQIDIKTKDEIGDLANAFNQMTTDLQKITVSRDDLVKEISEREKAEEQLKESEKRLSDITYSMADWIWEVNDKGVYTYCSEKVKDLLGYDSEEIIGKTPFDLMPPEEAQRIGETFLNIVKNKEIIKDLESWNLSKDGKQVYFLTNGVPILDEKGNLKGYRGVKKDITERKKAELEKEKLQSQLIQSSKMSAIGTLAGGIAHDFNNLLFVIQGNAEFLKLELPASAKELHVLVDNIKSSTTRGAELSKKLLAFARKEQYHLEPTNINQLMENAVSLLKRTVEKMITIETYLEPDIAVVMADTSQIHQAVLNLCINAKDAMPHAGKLIIETHNVVIDEHYVSTHLDARPGRFVVISISDTGIGMDKETSAHLFEPFFTTKERGKGVGLGLPVTYGIVKAHNGFINVYSEKGKGTCFKIYLPISEEKLEEKPIIKDEEIFEKGTGTILLTDDEVPVQELGKRILEKYGYQVLVANNGKKALEIYRQRKNEIIMVILDFIMPGWSGKETFEELKKINPDIKVLIATGYSLNSHGEELMHEGVKGFIQKPFAIKELLKTIKEILVK